MKFTKHAIFFTFIILIDVCIILSVKLISLKDENNTLNSQKSWYRFFFSEYAAALRMSQYGTATLDINHLLHQYSDEFIPIENLITNTICPANTNGAFTNEYSYFAARMMPLPKKDGVDLYAMSYLGSSDFIHSNKAFDALLTTDDFKKESLKLNESHGLINKWLSEHTWKDFIFKAKHDFGTSALMSYNSGDIDGEGRADFVLGRWLILSSLGYMKATEAPRRTMFIDNTLVAVENEMLIRYVWRNNTLEKISTTELRTSPHSNVPYIAMPLPNSKIAIRNEESLDIYNVTDENINYFATITGFSPSKIQTGAFGDFTGNGKEDVWLSQVASFKPYPEKDDQIILLQMDDIKPGENKLEEIAWFTIKGSSRYSDYDGIGTTLSPVAGDIDNDGIPDLSFTGHRHMNESGALYIISGKNIKQGNTIDIAHTNIVKILGKAMSQLAPPFHHWDAEDISKDGHSDIIISADNDLCSGLNAGAIYTLSGKKISKYMN